MVDLLHLVLVVPVVAPQVLSKLHQETMQLKQLVVAVAASEALDLDLTQREVVMVVLVLFYLLIQPKYLKK